jgi:hypothetical protein
MTVKTVPSARTARRDRNVAEPDAQIILRHWRDAAPDDRLAHLVKDATRALDRALTVRLARRGRSTLGVRASFGKRRAHAALSRGPA